MRRILLVALLLSVIPIAFGQPHSGRPAATWPNGQKLGNAQNVGNQQVPRQQAPVTNYVVQEQHQLHNWGNLPEKNFHNESYSREFREERRPSQERIVYGFNRGGYYSTTTYPYTYNTGYGTYVNEGYYGSYYSAPVEPYWDPFLGRRRHVRTVPFFPVVPIVPDQPRGSYPCYTDDNGNCRVDEHGNIIPLF